MDQSPDAMQGLKEFSQVKVTYIGLALSASGASCLIQSCAALLYHAPYSSRLRDMLRCMDASVSTHCAAVKMTFVDLVCNKA